MNAPFAAFRRSQIFTGKQLKKLVDLPF